MLAKGEVFDDPSVGLVGLEGAPLFGSEEMIDVWDMEILAKQTADLCSSPKGIVADDKNLRLFTTYN